jgi:toxin ParE1/3/4
MSRVSLSEIAEADLDSITDHIAREDPVAAVRVVDEIERRIAVLAERPNLGRRGRVAGTREMVLSGTPFIAIYRVQAPDVLILRVVHGARQWPPRRRR